MNKRILSLAVPNIVSNITIPLLGLVDLGLMGHLGSAVYVGAIAIGGMIFNFIFWGFSFLRMGTSGFTAQAYGQRDLREAVGILARSLTVGLAGSLLLILLQWPIAMFSFWIIGGSPEVAALARDYYYIRIYSAPATLAVYALTGWFIGMQNARIPMVLAISVNVLNILFSLFFIRVLGMNSDGIALANVCSQCTGLAIGLGLLWKFYGKVLHYWNLRAALQLQKLRRFLSVNKDIFIRTLCLIFVLSFFTTQSAHQSDNILAANTLLFQFFYFFSYLIDGFAYAGEALAGRSFGAKDREQLQKIVGLLFRWGLLVSLPFTLVYWLAGKQILELLTVNKGVVDTALPYLGWVVAVPLVTFSAFVWDGIYVGTTASKAMRNTMLSLTVLVFLPLYYLTFTGMGNHGLWMSMLAFMAGRGILLTATYRKAILRRM